LGAGLSEFDRERRVSQPIHLRDQVVGEHFSIVIGQHCEEGRGIDAVEEDRGVCAVGTPGPVPWTSWR
jgi:hypothetical protein